MDYSRRSICRDKLVHGNQLTALSFFGIGWGHLPSRRNQDFYSMARFVKGHTRPPKQLRRPRQPEGRAETEHEHEYEHEHDEAGWFRGLEGVHWWGCFAEWRGIPC